MLINVTEMLVWMGCPCSPTDVDRCVLIDCFLIKRLTYADDLVIRCPCSQQLARICSQYGSAATTRFNAKSSWNRAGQNNYPDVFICFCPQVWMEIKNAALCITGDLWGHKLYRRNMWALKGRRTHSSVCVNWMIETKKDESESKTGDSRRLVCKPLTAEAKCRCLWTSHPPKHDAGCSQSWRLWEFLCRNPDPVFYFENLPEGASFYSIHLILMSQQIMPSAPN